VVLVVPIRPPGPWRQVREGEHFSEWP